MGHTIIRVGNQFRPGRPGMVLPAPSDQPPASNRAQDIDAIMAAQLARAQDGGRIIVPSRRLVQPFIGGGGGGGPGLPDLSQLPVLNGQAPNNSAYNALAVASRPAGYTYNDPTSNVVIRKVTSASFPTTNRSAIPDYFESGPRISHPWGTGWQYTIDVYLDTASSGNLFDINKQHWLIDFDLQTGAFSNARVAPTGEPETARGFSLDASEPRMQYICDGRVLRKYDTSTVPSSEITTGGWPKDLTAFANGSDLNWLGHGIDARWFVMMNDAKNRLVAYNVDTNTVLTRTLTDFPGLDEPRVERNGRYAWVRHNTGNTWWDLDTNTLGSFRADSAASPQCYKGHSCTPRGYAAGGDAVYEGPQWYTTTATATPTILNASQDISWEVNNAGQWVTQSPADATQYFVHTGNTSQDSNVAWQNQFCEMSVCFLRIDGVDRRFLCHPYGAGALHTGSQYYCGYMWGQPSPDGRIVMFKSSMNSTTGRADTFIAEVPRAS